MKNTIKINKTLSQLEMDMTFHNVIWDKKIQTQQPPQQKQK